MENFPLIIFILLDALADGGFVIGPGKAAAKLPIAVKDSRRALKALDRELN